MLEDECVQFLQWALPQLRMRWRGFRKVRGQVCKRISRRMNQLGLDSVTAYRDYLCRHAEEWELLDSLCQVTVSRFYRDQSMYRLLAGEVLPDLVRRVQNRGEDCLKVWSAGCASGEEPYTVSLIWRLQLQAQFPGLSFFLLATDSDPVMRKRVADACYAYSTVKDLPADWRDTAFTREAQHYCLKPEFKNGILFRQQDVRETGPADSFDLVLCRNLVFTYFTEALQLGILERIRTLLVPGGALVIGIHESLPEGAGEFDEWSPRSGIYRKRIQGARTGG